MSKKATFSFSQIPTFSQKIVQNFPFGTKFPENPALGFIYYLLILKVSFQNRNKIILG